MVGLLVYLQIPAGRERFRALVAPERSLARVRSDVLLEDVGSDKRLVTEAARVFSLIVVTIHMCLQRVWILEVSAAYVAMIFELAGVVHLVQLQRRWIPETLLALITLVGFISSVDVKMNG